MTDRTLISMLASIVLFAMGPPGMAAAKERASLTAQDIAASMEAAARSDADRARDAQRKPDQVLAFMGLAKGMTVLDMFSGGGYYTEILSGAVGDKGAVFAQNNKAYTAYAKDEIASRFAADRLANVTRIMAENNELDLPESKFDMATLILAYHDIYYVDEKNGWPRIDGPKLLAEIYAALKPGAVLAVVDHAAESGAPADTGGTRHRIDPERVRKEIAAAGFVFEEQSDVLRNPDDQYDKSMADPEVRGKTDRFVYRFRKP